MKRKTAAATFLTLVLVLAVCLGRVVVSPVAAGPTYSVAQVLAGLTPQHNVWGGRALRVRAIAALAYDPRGRPNTALLFDHAPVGRSLGFTVSSSPLNRTFTLLAWDAWIARYLPEMRWLYGEHPAVYRVRFFQPSWCASRPVGQFE